MAWHCPGFVRLPEPTTVEYPLHTHTNIPTRDDNGLLFSFTSTLRAGSCRGCGSVVTGGTGVVAFTTYGAAGDGRVGAVAVPWFLCLCLQCIICTYISSVDD